MIARSTTISDAVGIRADRDRHFDMHLVDEAQRFVFRFAVVSRQIAVERIAALVERHRQAELRRVERLRALGFGDVNRFARVVPLAARRRVRVDLVAVRQRNPHA